MSTLRETLDRLLELQKADRERDKIVKAMHGLDTGKAAEAEATEAYQKSLAATGSLHSAQGELKDAELELATIEKKIKAFELKMQGGQVTNTREMMNIEKEIGQLNRLRTGLDDKILTLMDSLETLQVEAANAEAVSKQKEQHLASIKSELEQRRRLLDADLQNATQRRIASSSVVEDKLLLTKYDTMRTKPANGGLVIAKADDNMCGGCHMQAAGQDLRKAREATELVICPNCGRIMA